MYSFTSVEVIFSPMCLRLLVLINNIGAGPMTTIFKKKTFYIVYFKQLGPEFLCPEPSETRLSRIKVANVQTISE